MNKKKTLIHTDPSIHPWKLNERNHSTVYLRFGPAQPDAYRRLRPYTPNVHSSIRIMQHCRVTSRPGSLSYLDNSTTELFTRIFSNATPGQACGLLAEVDWEWWCASGWDFVPRSEERKVQEGGALRTVGGGEDCQLLVCQMCWVIYIHIYEYSSI